MRRRVAHGAHERGSNSTAPVAKLVSTPGDFRFRPARGARIKQLPWQFPVLSTPADEASGIVDAESNQNVF
ncbi:MAG: hypothetical protein WD851_02715 [Pirellulales bacterium]